MNLLSRENPVACIGLGPIILRYKLHSESGLVEFLPIPADLQENLVPERRRRPSHPSFEGREEMFCWENRDPDPLVQIAVRGLPAHPNWQAGHTMRNQAATSSLKFVRQELREEGGLTFVETHLHSAEFSFSAIHRVSWKPGDIGVVVETTIINTGSSALPVELVSSFSLAGISPFCDDDAHGRLRLHRFRFAWSTEGRHEDESFEKLHLERTWGGGVVNLRYGQVGSLPVRGFYPYAAIEDRKARVFWGAQIAWHGSWQMEVYRRGDDVALSGGLGDFEFAHWMKEIAPGDSFTTPPALVGTHCGDFEEFCDVMVRLQERLAYPEPEIENELPPVFNEWCSTWGNPTHDYVVRTAEAMRPLGLRYFVIDDGWAEKPPGETFQFNGDWNVNLASFPGGLSETTNALREMGIVPGIWFEFEPCTEGTKAYELCDHQLHRHGKVIQVGRRHFWDFRDPWTFDYLREKVIRLLKENHFGYLKVDYNESIGIGCDGAESLGEGLRAHLEKVREFFLLIRREIPDLMIENCSSGGHRQEPGMIGITTMSSFSDAHETVEIPIIAANLHRLLPMRKNQVWAVLRPDESRERTIYSLAATFLGRPCVSGDLVQMPDDRRFLLRDAMELYRQAVPLIRDGFSRILRHTGESIRYPEGWQAVIRCARDGSQALVITHFFDSPPQSATVPLGPGTWEIVGAFPDATTVQIEGAGIQFSAIAPFTARVLLVRNTGKDS